MLKDITIGQYFPGVSPLHRADPRVKIILTTLFMVLLFLVNSYWSLAAVLLFTTLVIVVSGIPVRYTLKGLKSVLLIVVFAGAVNLFTTAGTPLSGGGPLHYITWEGVDITIRMTFRISLLVIGASLLTFTSSPISLTDGIEKLMGPFKRIGIPVHEIAMMMSIALRFIPTLLEETDKIMKAQAARGADFDTGNLLQRARSFVPVLVPLFVSAFRRADDLAVAMESRCYRGSAGRTRMKQLRLSPVDFKVSAVMVLFTLGVLIVEYI